MSIRRLESRRAIAVLVVWASCASMDPPANADPIRPGSPLPSDLFTQQQQMIAQWNDAASQVDWNALNRAISNTRYGPAAPLTRPPDVPMPPPTALLPPAPELIQYAPNLPPGILPSPIPEPGTLALFSAALAWLGIRYGKGFKFTSGPP